MKKLFLLMITTCLVFSAFADIDLGDKRRKKKKSFNEGNQIASVGYGVFNLGKSMYKVYENFEGFKAFGFGPLHAKYEYALSDKIGFGLSINYVNYGVKFTETGTEMEYDSAGWPTGNSKTVVWNTTISNTSLSFLGRMNYHFATTDKLDPYVGFGIGYRSYKFKVESDNDLFKFDYSGIPIGMEFTFGMRYYITPNFGLYTELGFASALAQFGGSFKF